MFALRQKNVNIYKAASMITIINECRDFYMQLMTIDIKIVLDREDPQVNTAIS